MITSWFTFKKWEALLQRKYTGKVLDKCLTYQKNECLLVFRDTESLLVHLGSPFFYLLFQDTPPVRKSSIRVFPGAEGLIVESVTLYSRDRVLEFLLRDGSRLCLALTSRRGNIFLEKDREISSFKKVSELPDLGSMREQPPADFSSIRDDFRFNRFWKNTIEEIFNTADYEEILNCLKSSNGFSTKGRFVLGCGDIFNMETFYGNYRDHVINFLREDNFDRCSEEIKAVLGGHLQRLERQIKKSSQKDAISKRIELNTYYAECLNGLRYLLQTGMNSLLIPDYLQKEGFPHSIPLKNDLQPNEQIDRYYRRVKKGRQELEDIEERVSGLISQRDELKSLYDELESLESISDLRSWESRHKERLDLLKKQAADPAGERLPYRQVIFEKNWRIWIGRSARDNDDMTFHYAGKQDLWLHTRHSTGSHVIIKKDGRKDVPAPVIRHAASLAARYSDEKHSSLVTVVCTLRKYVTKRKGMPPGKVHYQYEKDYMVTPA